MKKALYLLVFLNFFILISLSAQNEEKAVREVVDRMFESMYEGDSAKLRTCFYSTDVPMMTSGFRNGKPFLSQGNLERFANAVGTPHDEMWDERIWDVKIMVDDNMAIAWMDYAFYLGDKFSHCGVNNFTFFKSEEGWKIVSISDSRRSEGCDIPKKVSRKG